MPATSSQISAKNDTKIPTLRQAQGDTY